MPKSQPQPTNPGWEYINSERYIPLFDQPPCHGYTPLTDPEADPAGVSHRKSMDNGDTTYMWSGEKP